MQNLFEYTDGLNQPMEAFYHATQPWNFPILPHWHYFIEIILTVFLIFTKQNDSHLTVIDTENTKNMSNSEILPYHSILYSPRKQDTWEDIKYIQYMK